ncbi:MAG: DMT family transporter [Alphaproteobacteria bacterium]|nr:DMT family transporter [Alphaproteobacteria bacterium]
MKRALGSFLSTPSMKLGIAIASVATILFGMGPPFSRAAYADGANAVFMALVTMFFRGLFLVGYCRWKHLKLFESRRTLKITVTGGFFHALGMAALFGALVTLQAPIALMILYLFPLGLLLFLAARGEQKLTALLIGLVFAALLGLSFVLKVWEVDGEISWVGIAFALVAAFGVGARIFIHGKQMETQIPSIVGAENFIVAFCFTLLLVFWNMPILPQTVGGYVWAGLCALVFGLGSLLSFYGMSLTGPFFWGFFGKLEPVYAALFAALFFGEYLSSSQYVGMAIVLASLLIYQCGEKSNGLRRSSLNSRSGCSSSIPSPRMEST